MRYSFIYGGLLSTTLAMLLASCSMPAPRVHYSLDRFDDLVLSNSPSLAKFELPAKQGENVIFSFSALLKNTSLIKTYEVLLKDARTLAGSAETSASCQKHKGDGTSVSFAPNGIMRIDCTVTFGPSDLERLRNKDILATTSIPYKVGDNRSALIFQYQLRLEDFE